MLILRRLRPYAAVTPLLLALLLLVLYPVVALLYGSITTGSPRAFHFDPSQLTLKNYIQVYSSGAVWEATLNTIAVVVGSAALALIIAAFFAWLVARSNVPARGLVEAAALMPLFVSPLIAALAWSSLGSPRAGLLNVVFRDLGVPVQVNFHSRLGVLLVMAVYYAPYAYMFLVSALHRMDPILEEAAAVCGANTWATIRKVTLPLILHAVLSAVILVGVIMLAVYAIPAILGEPSQIPFLTTHLYKLVMTSPADYQSAATISVLLIAVTFFGVWVQNRLMAGRRFTTIAGKGLRPKRIDLGRWKYVCLAAAVAYIGVAIVLPYAAIVLSAIRAHMFIPKLSAMLDPKFIGLMNFKLLFSNALTTRSIYNTVIVGVTAAGLGAVLCFLLAYVIYRTKLPLRQTVNYLSMLPVAIPGLVIGVAYLWAWIMLPFGLYGTVGIIILAHVARFLPDGVRAASATLVQIHEELEESARICGAPFLATVRKVVVPLAKPGLVSSALLLFTLSVRELGATVFLYTSGSMTMSVQILQQWEGGRWGPTAALALLQSALLLVFTLAGRWAFRWDLQSN